MKFSFKLGTAWQQVYCKYQVCYPVSVPPLANVRPVVSISNDATQDLHQHGQSIAFVASCAWTPMASTFIPHSVFTRTAWSSFKDADGDNLLQAVHHEQYSFSHTHACTPLLPMHAFLRTHVHPHPTPPYACCSHLDHLSLSHTHTHRHTHTHKHTQ